MPVASFSIMSVIEGLVGDLFKFSVDKIGQTEAFQKLRRKYFPEQRNDFLEIYSRTLIDLWYKEQNKNLIALFKEPEIVDALYNELFKRVTNIQVSHQIERVYRALKIGDDLNAAGIPAEEAIAIFRKEFKKQIEENGSITDVVRHDELKDAFRELLCQQNRTLLNKFETEPNFLTESDILKAICAEDITLKKYGIFYAAHYKFKGAASLIIDNLYTTDAILLSNALEAIGVLRIVKATERVIALFTDPDESISKQSKWIYFTYLAEVNKNNFPQWLQWLHAKEKMLQINAIKAIYELSDKGMIDIVSILSDLIEELNNKDPYVREYIYRTLLHYNKQVPGITWEDTLLKEADEDSNTLCVSRILFLQGKDEVVGKLMLEKLEKQPENANRFAKTFTLCRYSSNKICQSAWTSYKQMLGSIIETANLEHLFKPVPIKPNAFTKEHTFKEYQHLNGEKELAYFLEKVSQRQLMFPSNRKSADTIVLDTEASIITVNGAMRFLEQRHSYTCIDFREKTELETNAIVTDFKGTSKICLVLSKDFSFYCENILRTIYDDKAVILYNNQNKPERVTIDDSVKLLLFVTLETYNELSSNNSFARFVGATISIPVLTGFDA